jgi:hypothetical protein
MNDIKEAYMSVPPISRYYMTIVFTLSFCITYKIINPYYLYLDFELVFYKVQVLF